MKSIILSSKIEIDKYEKINFLIDQDLLKFISDINCNILPISLKKNKIDKNCLKLSSGLILSGGGDIYEHKKNQINKIRDTYEKYLFNYFLKRNKPILLICRGFQLITNFKNGKLFKIKNHVRTFHSLNLKKNKFIKYKKLNVNSYHNYAVKKLPRNFLNIASTKDGSIEIAEHKNKKVLCLMFHPERKMKSKKLIFKSIKNFFR
jgi:gamma-glutamyl-gamma-aminobutyrate hydrolase PuuD|tara:strand:+ start:1191 stop:1805 length:615 start_codon:yes stop_codon:yes gene_type:complete